MYGKNNSSPKKRAVADGLKVGKSFELLGWELAVATATAEVYGIDCLAAGEEVDHNLVAKNLQITPESFERVKVGIMSNHNNSLRSIRDELADFSYNQIRFVLACLIQEVEL